jgi:vacuolar-type H+-ATPase subunit F/Vma7
MVADTETLASGARRRAAPVFIGDELSAAGFRLAGAVVRTPPAEEAAAVFEQARREAPLVVITAEFAAAIARAQLVRALAAPRPLVLVVPDVRARRLPANVAQELRRELGMEAGR